jgi:diaminopimelate decarboxylase
MSTNLYCPITLKDIQQIEKKTKGPFYYYDYNMIDVNCKKFISSFQKYFKQFRNFYQIKALTNASILENLFRSGMDFEVSSREELELLSEINILPKHIMYTNNFTTKEIMQHVYNEQVNVNLDNITELDMFENLRKKFDNKFFVHDNIICFNFNPLFKFDQENIFSKFGITEDEIIQAYIKAKNMGYNNFGIRCINYNNNDDINKYIDSYNIDYYDILFSKIFKIISELQNNEIPINFINIGEIYNITEETPAKLRKLFDKYIEIYDIETEPDLYTECTDYITKDYGWLITKCESIKKLNNQIYYGVNSSINHVFNHVINNKNLDISVFGKKNDNQITANIVGNMYNQYDYFAKNILVPEINIGDYVIIHNVGSNSEYMGLNYNSKLKCASFMLKDKNIQTILTEYNYDDLYSHDIRVTYYKTQNNMNVIIYSILIYILSIILYIKFI